MKVLIIAAVLALVAGAASAQQLRTFGTPDRGYTVQTPGQSPTYVTPTPSGGYTFQTPGQLPTYATPNTGGGYILQQSGRSPTYMRQQ
jgi:hypothetical protein